MNQTMPALSSNKYCLLRDHRAMKKKYINMAVIWLDPDACFVLIKWPLLNSNPTDAKCWSNGTAATILKINIGRKINWLSHFLESNFLATDDYKVYWFVRLPENETHIPCHRSLFFICTMKYLTNYKKL